MNLLFIQATHNTFINKILTSDKDLVGVIFFGTTKTQNPNGFKHIYVLQDLDTPGVQQIRQLEDMKQSDYDFEGEFGCDDTYSLAEALWTCANVFSACAQRTSSKRIMLFTNTDDPHAGDAGLKLQTQTKARDLSEIGISIDLLHLAKAGQRFDLNAFYADIISFNNVRVQKLKAGGGVRIWGARTTGKRPRPCVVCQKFPLPCF